MRDDAIGMFWQDIPTERGSRRHALVMPPIPDTGWIPPQEFPDLRYATAISIDTETYDPDLLTKGPGWARGVGHIVGVSVAAFDRQGRKTNKYYFPIRHEVEKEYNLDPEKVFAWLRHTLGNPTQPKIGANLTYDIGWLRAEGVEVAGDLIDVQFAEALLDEAAPVALESLGQKYLDEGKESPFLYQWLSDYYGGAVNDKQRKNIYRAPPRLVGPYAESDADLPLRLAPILYKLLMNEDLLDLFLMECELIRLMIDMRYEGVSVNLQEAERVQQELDKRTILIGEDLRHKLGFTPNVDSGIDMARVFDQLGLSYNYTEKGNPSFTKDFLAKVKHPIVDQLMEIRKCDKIRGTFIESYILNSHINGKVYGQFHQLRGEGGGTRSGRYSSSTPNLQNIPSRDDELAPLVRGMFIPDPGHKQWRKYDYSQVEYRLLIHYAVGQAGEEIRAYFNAHPETDYHDYAQDIIKQKTGQFIERKPIKNINFGLIYGMGVPTLAETMGLSLKDGKALVKVYFEGVPFAKPTMEAAMEEAQKFGVITTILNRKSRFESWEPTRWGKKSIPLSYEKAILQYGRIKRAMTHKALNRRLQGSAADLMKKAMHQCYHDGVFEGTGTPRLTVHDELDFSDDGDKRREEAFREMQHIMENAIQFKIPITADGEIGPDWGHVKKALATS